MKKRNGSQERYSQQGKQGCPVSKGHQNIHQNLQEERLGEFCQKTGTEEARTGNKTLSSKAVRAEQSAHPCSAVSSVSEAVGLKIRYYRESRGWSIRDMEAELAVAVNSPRTRSSISMWENNRRSCSIEHIPALCELFGVTPNDLIEKPNSMDADAEADVDLDFDMLRKSLCPYILSQRDLSRFSILSARTGSLGLFSLIDVEYKF